MVTDDLDLFLLGLHVSDIPVRALLESGATHCFIDSTLVSDHCLPMTLLPQPMRLCLFNGLYASENILYEVTVPIHFAPAKVLLVSFLVTLLDPDVSTVIRLHWLHQYNPLVDRASKRLICIPTHDKVDAPEIVKLFIHHIFAKHGVLLHVTCDCRSEFTLQFFRSLGMLLNIKLHFTSGYNPQADGQLEQANQTLEQYL